MLGWLTHNDGTTGTAASGTDASVTVAGGKWLLLGNHHGHAIEHRSLLRRLGRLIGLAVVVLAACSVAGIAHGRDDAHPLDMDDEQRENIAEEFLAITDRATEIQIEEMPAYWRLLSWVQDQSFENLGRRARSDLLLMDLYHRPSAHRGQLLSLDLNVCRALTYDIPDNVLGIRKLYEIWGYTSQSGTKLYVGITPELPDGFPIGASISERAKFCGYFFKLQGYLEAKAAPRSRPLAAPLLLGKMEWQPKQAAPTRNAETPWLIGLAICAFGLLSIRVLPAIFWKRRTARRLATNDGTLTADEWWQRLQEAHPESAPARSSATLNQNQGS